MEIARPRFPCPRVRHAPAHVFSGHPPRVDYEAQPPPIHAQPGEKLRPLSRPPGPGFRASRPPRFPSEDHTRKPFLRGDFPGPGFNRGEFPPQSMQPEEGFTHPRPKFAPPAAVPRGPRPPPERAFRFPRPPMGQRPFPDHSSMEETEMNGGPFRVRPYQEENCQVARHEPQEGGWDDWSRWSEDDGGTDPSWSGHDLPKMTEGSHHLERNSEMEPSHFGSSGGDARPQTRIRFVGRSRPITPSSAIPRQTDGWQPAKTRTEHSEMAMDCRPSENEQGSNREYGWTEPEPAGPRDPGFLHPDPDYFESSSGQGFVDLESPGAGGQSGQRRDRRSYEQRPGNETVTRTAVRHDPQPLKRSSSHLDSPPMPKRDRPMMAKSQNARSLASHERSRTGSRSIKDRDFVEHSGSGSPRHRRSLNSGSAARVDHHDSMIENRSTDGRNENRFVSRLTCVWT